VLLPVRSFKPCAEEFLEKKVAIVVSPDQLQSYQLGKLKIMPGLVLSPMSGVTGSAFRRLIRELNPGSVGLVVSEFVSVEALTRHIPRTMEMMRFHPDERPLGIQIFGYDIERMVEGARMAEAAGADVVDINCGCPAPKVVRKGGGCELMRQPLHLARIIRAVRAAISIPLTIKIRSGYDQQSQNALQVSKIAQDEGADGLAIHPRTRAQMYRGRADWDLVYEVASAVAIPVLGSGDITAREDALARLGNSTGGRLAGLLIGRAALSNPMIFGEIISGRSLQVRHSAALALAILGRYAELLSETLPPKAAVGRMKQLSSGMCRGYEWRKPLLMASSFDEQRRLIDALGKGFQALPGIAPPPP